MQPSSFKPFSSPKQKTPPPLSNCSSFFLPTTGLGNANLLSASMDLPVLDNSYTLESYNIYVLLCLASFTQHHVLFCFFKAFIYFHLAGVAQWTESWPANQRVASLVPSQGTCLGCRPGPQWGCTRGKHTLMFLPLSFFPYSPVKINKIF